MQLRHASAAWRVPHTLIATTCAPAHSQTAGGAGAAEGDQQTLPFITNNITTKRLGQGQASWRAGARPVHPCAPPRCSMLLERPRPTSGRGATASLCCVALYVSWIHLVPHTRGFAALKKAFEGPKPPKPNNRVHTSRGTTPGTIHPHEHITTHQSTHTELTATDAKCT